MKKQALISFVLILSNLTTIDASHFNGGTITWYPIDPSSNSSSVTITIVQTYSWGMPPMVCSTNVPTSTNVSLYYTVNLTCAANCTTDGGYSTKPISIQTDCISSSSSMGTMTSQRAVNITLNSTAHFTLAYKSLAWRTIRNYNGTNPGWFIATLINLGKRPDGLINTAPVSTVASPRYVVSNRRTSIRIPVTDANDGDDLRCRWALASGGSTNTNECDDTCFPSGFPPNTSLSNCILTFTALTPDTWYVVSLQVEDYINTSSTTPMSSVPVQFLIYVMANLSCTIEPEFLPLTDCYEVQVGAPVNLSLYVMNYCNSSRSIVIDIVDTVSITGMTVSNITNSTTNTSLSYVTLDWTPQTSQVGQQQFCATAYTNEKVQSTEYCVTFTVSTVSYVCQTTTITTITSGMSQTTTTSVTTTITTITSGTPQTTTTSVTKTTTTSSKTTSSTSSTVTSMITTTSTSFTTSTVTPTTTKTTTSNSTMSSSTTAASAIETTTSTKRNGTSWGLIAGILSVALPLGLCTCFCLYRYVWSPRAKRQQQQEEEADEQEENRWGYSHLTSRSESMMRTTSTSNTNQEAKIEVPKKSYQVYNIRSQQISTDSISSTSGNQGSILVSIYNSTNARRPSPLQTNNSEQSFEMTEARSKSKT